MDKPKRKHVGAYEVGETLGQGAFGKVKLGINIFSGEKVAIKIISHAGSRTTKEVLQLERERNILLKLSHPNIVNLLKVVDDPARNRCYMIFEYVEGGELFDYIVNHGRLSEKDARKFMRQIISAVEYCHSMLVIHRDLKPENLLLDGKLNIKITDFGLSNIMEPGKRFSTFCGSLHYACPEILQGKEYLGPGVDIWAMGIILYCLVVGRQPWDGANAEELISTILDDGLEIPDSISDNCVDLILQMLRVKEDDRIPIPEMRFHPWILEGYDTPPPSFLPSVEPIQRIEQTIIDQMQSMGIITADNLESVKSALLKGDKENQVICIYHLLFQQQLQNSQQKKEAPKPKPKPKPPVKPEKISQTDPAPRTRSQSVSVPQRKDQQVGSTGRAHPEPIRKQKSIERKDRPIRDKTSEKEDRISPPDSPKCLTDLIEPPPSPLRKNTSQNSSRKKIVVTIPRPIAGSPNPLLESSSPPDRHSTSLSSSPVSLSPVVVPRRKSVLTESAPSGERLRSVSAAPKPILSPKKVVTERNASPSKKQDRPILALGDISSGKIKPNSRPGSPVSSPQKALDTSRARPPRKTLNDIFKDMPRAVSDDSDVRSASTPRPVAPEEDEQKNLPFELKTKLISTLNSSQLKEEVERSLKTLSLSYKKKGDTKFKCETKVEDSSITFSIEIIKTDKHNLALKIKRLGGSGFGYKIVHERLVQEFQLHY